MESFRWHTRSISLFLVFLLLAAVLPAQAANICDPVTGAQCQAVAADGAASVRSVPRTSCSAGTTALTASAAGTGIFFEICGSASKIVKVHRLVIGGRIATTAAIASVILDKTSAAPTSGTKTQLTQAPMDSTNPACTANSVALYTALGTAGASVGVLGARTGVWPILATVAATDVDPIYFWDFGSPEEVQPVTLRGTAQCIQARMGATTTNAPSLVINVKWTEE